MPLNAVLTNVLERDIDLRLSSALDCLVRRLWLCRKQPTDLRFCMRSKWLRSLWPSCATDRAAERAGHVRLVLPDDDERTERVGELGCGQLAWSRIVDSTSSAKCADGDCSNPKRAGCDGLRRSGLKCALAVVVGGRYMLRRLYALCCGLLSAA